VSNAPIAPELATTQSGRLVDVEPRGSPKTGQLGSPENRSVVGPHIQDIDSGERRLSSVLVRMS
jgi:hypothetical protein